MSTMSTTGTVRYRPDSVGKRRQKQAIATTDKTLARLPCDACGHVGLALLVRFCRQTGSYHPLAYCPGCGESVEF